MQRAGQLLAQAPLVGLALYPGPDAYARGSARGNASAAPLPELMALATAAGAVVLDLASTPQVAELLATDRAFACLDAKAHGRALLRRGLALPRRWAALEVTAALLACGQGAPEGDAPDNRGETRGETRGGTPAGVGADAGVDALAKRYDLPAPPPQHDVASLAARASFFSAVAARQAQAVQRAHLVPISRLEAQVVTPLTHLEAAGLPFCRERWDACLAAEDAARRALQARLLPQLGIDAATLDGSPAALLAALRRAGHAVPSLREADLAGAGALPAALGQYVHLLRLSRSWGASLLRCVDGADGRMRGHFVQLGAQTGRIACQAPNLQAVPKKGGRRGCFRPSVQRRLVVADYAACELRILAQMSGDAAYLAAFARGDDVHAAVAAQMFGVRVDRTERPELREAAKTLSFGLIYGMQVAGLATLLQRPQHEAQALSDRFFATYPSIRAYLEDSEATALRQGYAESRVGRRLALDAAALARPQTAGYVRRLARNMPIQGTGADLLKVATITLHRRLQRSVPRAQVVHCVHDALLVECEADDAAQVAELTRAAMQQAGARLLPDVGCAVDVDVMEAWH